MVLLISILDIPKHIVIINNWVWSTLDKNYVTNFASRIKDLQFSLYIFSWIAKISEYTWSWFNLIILGYITNNASVFMFVSMLSRRIWWVIFLSCRATLPISWRMWFLTMFSRRRRLRSMSLWRRTWILVLPRWSWWRRWMLSWFYWTIWAYDSSLSWRWWPTFRPRFNRSKEVIYL